MDLLARLSASPVMHLRALLRRSPGVLAQTGYLSARPTRLPQTRAELGVFAERAAHCAALLARAERLIGHPGGDARLCELVHGAGDCLDDIDDVLVALHPLRDAGCFADAARLHRDLARVLAAIPRSQRVRPPRARGGRPVAREAPAGSKSAAA